MYFIRRLKIEDYWNGQDFVKKNKAKNYKTLERAEKIKSKLIERYKQDYQKELKLEIVSFK